MANSISEPFVLRKSENQFQCITTVTLKIKIEGKNYLETCSSFMKTNTINSFEFPEIPKSGGSFFFHFDWFDWSGNFISINRTLKLQDQNICIRKEMKRDIRIIQKVTLSSPCLLACFHPLSPLSVCPQSNEILFKSQYEMLKLSIECTRFESNYNSWKKERPNETQFTTKIGGKTSLCPSYFVL
jgi:hypothetical protein